MNIPIVQGTAIPSAGKPSTYYNTTDPYVASSDGNVASFHNQDNGQRKQFRDVPWAILFVAHLVVMLAIISMNLVSNGGGMQGSFGGITWFVGVTGIASIGVGSVALSLMMRFATAIVKIALLFTVGMSLAVGVLGLMSGQILMGVLGLIMFAVGICYAMMVWPRIPFAAANLNTALTAVRANMGLTVVAYLQLFLALGWSVIWIVGLGDAISSSNLGVLFLLFLSYYWVNEVLANTVHVTTAGTIGTWWFVPDEANSCCSAAIQDSFCRATTYSFGSICLGSLLVAIVQALRAINEQARQNDDMQMLACIIDCILSCIQDIIEYLNKWAYVYVGLYGFGYIEAGKNVMQLFEQKGWTVVISDDLCDRALLMVSLAVGLLTGLVGLALAAADQSLLAALELEEGVGAAGFIIGLVVGFVFSSILMSVVASAVNTVIVCYAESPAEFQTNHPQLSAEMRAAWIQAYPGLI